MGKVIGGILGTLTIVVLVLFLLLHFGLLSWGKNSGNGDKKSEEAEIEVSTTTDEIEEITITIVVMQDKYFIDEQEVTLTQINEKVTDKSAIIKVGSVKKFVSLVKNDSFLVRI